MVELKKCPFCGGTNLRVKPVWKTYRFVACQDCKAGGPVAKTDERAIELWNERSRSADKTCHAIFGECSECKWPLSDFASYCPHCGARIEVKR